MYTKGVKNIEMIVLPFFLLLFTIALGPLLFEKFWSKNYPYIIAFFSCIVVGFYLFSLKDFNPIILSVVEFFQFISLILALYTVTSGIFIDINLKPTTKNNIIFLILGSIIANFIGTTGASMLLIRPFLKMNEKKLKPYHVAFFIFIISNVGGALTPIGDPPLFIGFLKGIPFFWTLMHNFLPWLFVLTLLCCVFYFYDSKNQNGIDFTQEKGQILKLQGHKNIFFIVAIICSVFVNPIVFPSLPMIKFHGHEISFIREILFLTITIASCIFTDKKILKENHFSWEPIRELTILFLGIFITMTPVLTALTATIQGVDPEKITTSSLFWGTGFLSSFLDNAPTYLNFLTISMSSHMLDVASVKDVMSYANGNVLNSVNELRAISIGSVFFGAMTYIGNGPNLMVKTIAEQKVKMPTFFKYITSYSFKILLPILFVCWLIFCR